MSEVITVDLEKLKRLVLMAKNDAMMMEAYSRHNPIGDTTEELRQSVIDDMRLVNEFAARCGMEMPFYDGDDK